ncbi:30S ribosomal protein S1 [Gemelliphila asaccharolytica]|uniref:Ribosomal protein S1 n=1 Tax=Gemelliphila asaccharolytica TaxID=502393 RepID=A0ABR5TPP3_9BACL|nr:30S ribosomal protein S1 [Gemella asaccharolytica]KXB58670.1 putative ribosomal protein S1 [Gemella asaccharolytica]
MTTSFEELLNSTEMLKKGDKVTGTVSAIEENKAYVDVSGAQYDCVILKNQISRKFVKNISDFLKIGEEIEAIVTGIRADREKKSEEVPGVIYLSRKAIENQEYKKELDSEWEEIIAKHQNNDLIDATVSSVIKGGLLANIKGIRAFVPASLIDIKFVKNLQNYLNKEYKFKIAEIDRAKGRLILDRKTLLEEEKDKKIKDILNSLNVGDELEGKVIRIANFGAFVNIGDIDGLVHISEISHNRFKKIEDVLKIGDIVKVAVINLDKENNKVALSIKKLLPTPWEIATKEISVGDELEGKVKNITDFGAFVEVMDGVEGLVHISQISYDRVEKIEDVLKRDELVKVKVLDVDFDKKRLSLSIKETKEKPVKKIDKKEDDENSFDTSYLKSENSEFSLADKFKELK